MARPGISLCMIVKNEQDNLASCLESVCSIVDEIIIVDTGSDDDTAEIGRKYTPHVFDFKWCNDFAAARNASISKATQPWILVLDADELLEPSCLFWFKSNWNQPDIDGYLVTIKNKVSRGNPDISHQVIRLFRNQKNLRYERPIHEIVPIPERKTALSELRILHFGYANEEKNPQRHHRNETLLLKFKKENPHLASSDFYLAQHFYSKGNHQKAFEHASLALDKNPEPLIKRQSLRIALEISAYQADLSSFQALKTTHNPSSDSWPEIHLFDAIAHYQSGDLSAALTQLNQYIQPRDTNESLNFSDANELSSAYLGRAYELRGSVFSKKGFYEAALQDYEKAGSIFPHKWDLLAQKGQTLFKLGKLELALHAFGQVVKLLENEKGAEPLLAQYSTLVSKIRNVVRSSKNSK